MTPDEALRMLKEGNERFVTDAPFRGVQGRERRVEVARGQRPFAVLVGCSDSRVPPELLFGRGLGELFIVRVAGNTVDLTARGSVEYAVAELGVPLVLVLGHERCGAVAAAVEVVASNATFPGAIGEVVEPIVPAVLRAKAQPGELLDNAVRENVRRVVTRLRGNGAILPAMAEAGRRKVVGARYDRDDGAVDFVAEG
jgi:carbonic anhydrase